jgi:hypothetical protein
MNTKNIIKLVAALAWGGVAVSSATSAQANALTRQTGAYATCSSWTSTGLACGEFNYVQKVSFGATPCSSGGCSGALIVNTMSIYTTGRKTATFMYVDCEMNRYGLGTCAC